MAPHSTTESPAPPPPGLAGLSGPADLGRRLLARLLDAVMVGLPASALLAILGLPAPTIPLGGVDAWTRGAVTCLAWLAYYVVCESQFGATIGKRVSGLRVVSNDGHGHPTVTAALLRNLWIAFGLVPLVGGIGMVAAMVAIAVGIARDEHHRGIHDRIGATVVMR